MSSAIWHVTMSLDGFIAGADDSMDWAATTWDTTTSFEDRRPSTLADEVMDSTGAILAGRRWYDVATARFNGVDGIYGGDWTGPVFVLTHRPPGGEHHPAITFLSDDLPTALATAREAAGGRNVVLFGASIPQQCLRAGLLDEVVIHLAPILLGDGIRLVEQPGIGPVILERTTLAESGQITDLRFRVRR